jgi:hypothetical protein
MARPDIAQFVLAGAFEAAHRDLRGWAYDDPILNEPWGFAPSELATTVPIDLWWGTTCRFRPPMPGSSPANFRTQRCTCVPGGGHFGGIFDHLDEIFEALLTDGPEADAALVHSTPEAEPV